MATNNEISISVRFDDSQYKSNPKPASSTPRRWSMLMLLTLLIFMIASCNTGDVAYMQYHDLHGWDRTQALEYNLEGVDTMPRHTDKSRYEMSLNIRIDNNYNYTTLPVLMEVESPAGRCSTDTLLIPVPASDKRQQSVGGLSTLEYPVNQNFALPKSCRITLTQISNQDQLKGIVSIGLMLKEKKK